MRKHEQVLVIFTFFLILLSARHAAAQITCGTTCYTAQQVADEAARYQSGVPGSMCLFIYNNQIYQPPSGTISSGSHFGHACGSDVTGQMRQSHASNPSHYLVPYVCAPLCTSPPPPPPDTTPPTVLISSPANGAAVLGTTTITAAASDNVGVVGVQFKIDGSNQGAEIASPPYSVSWNTAGAANGNHAITAVARDAAGNTATSTSVSVNLNNAVPSPPDTTPPTISISAPAAGATLSGTAALTATASDNVGVVGVQFKIDGSNIGNEATSQPYSYSWDTSAASNGAHTVTATARDAAGNTATAVSITVSNSGSQHPPSPPPLQNQSEPPYTPGPPACTPLCNESCGQDNGCGGKCSNSDIYTQGKCGNPVCTPVCTNACGQPDGCGKICPSIDKNTCGLCGNAPCCLDHEICGNGIDDNCDGKIDEGCGVLDQAFTAGSSGAILAAKTFEMAFTQPSMLARLAGLAAFFFAGFTLLIGLFRFELIKRFSRKEIIKYHSVVGFFSILFLVIHVAAVLMDTNGWAYMIPLKSVFLPQFSGMVLFNAALGTIGMYLLLVTIVTGVLFIKISRKLGYRTWTYLHKLSFLFYAFIFLHAVAIGSDFKNIYMTLFFSHVLFVIGFYMTYRTAKISAVNEKLEEVALRLRIKKCMSVNDLVNHPEMVYPAMIGKSVILSGTVAKVPMQGAEKDWYVIYDGHARIFAKIPEGAKQNRYSRIKGTVMKEENQLYIQVTGLKV